MSDQPAAKHGGKHKSGRAIQLTALRAVAFAALMTPLLLLAPRVQALSVTDQTSNNSFTGVLERGLGGKAASSVSNGSFMEGGQRAPGGGVSIVSGGPGTTLTGSQPVSESMDAASSPEASASTAAQMLEGQNGLVLPNQNADTSSLRIFGEPAPTIEKSLQSSLKPGRLLAGLLMLMAAVACGLAAKGQGGVRGETRGRAAWAALAGVLVLLAINRAFDGLGAVTDLLREEALSEGWYAVRRPIQATVLGLLLLTLIGAGYAAWRRWRPGADHAVPGLGRAVLGTALLTAMSLMRGVSLHQVDALLARHLGSLTGSALADVVGLAFLAAGLWRHFQGRP